MTKLFIQFFKKREIFEILIRQLTEIDCLLSLAVASSNKEGHLVRPILIEYEGQFKDKAYFEVRDMRHPCVSLGKNFIPNDTLIDTRNKGLLLITGPNMGGKSTLLR